MQRCEWRINAQTTPYTCADTAPSPSPVYFPPAGVQRPAVRQRVTKHPAVARALLVAASSALERKNVSFARLEKRWGGAR